MTPDAWAALVSGVVVPLLLRIAVHFWPWLADGPERPDAGRRHAAEPGAEPGEDPPSA